MTLRIQQPKVPLEVELLAIKQEFKDLNTATNTAKVKLYRGWLRWQNERSTSLRDYLRNAYPDFDTREGSAYSHLYSGAALTHDLPGQYNSDLEPFGWALTTGGKTAHDVEALISEHGPEKARSLLRVERSSKAREGTTVRRMPESAATALDGLATRLQGIPGMPAEDTERRGVAIQMLEAAPGAVFEALAVMVSTGENTMDALSAALTAYTSDVYEAMKRQGCAWPGCETHHGLELHHLPIDEETKRANDVLLALCPYHHNQDGKHDRAHSLGIWALYEVYGGPAQFWQALAVRQAEAIQAARKGL